MNTLGQLNTYSQESVNYDDQGTGAQTLADRYQINGLIDTAQPVMTNIEKICSAAGSWLSYDNHEGKWGVVINKAGTSIASFTDSNIIGSITLTGTGLADLYNSVKVQFPHRDIRDSGDFVTIEIPDGDRNANEPDNALNLNYDIINEPIQAQLLGFIELKQSRVDLVIEFESDFSYINLKAGDIIDVTNTRYGFTNKLFRIISTAEIQDDIAIRVKITALEYDANVYSTADLYRYTRTDENGIITIGSIGVPGTPQVSKFERDARPRIIVETTAPTGIVEGIEYWITNDVNVAQDANRSYRLISTKRPSPASYFTSGESVVLDYDSLVGQNFFVKTRGFNATTTGPFSTPSGLVEYAPVQETQAITPETAVFDETGALLTAFGASLLMNKVSDLILGSASSGSLFSSVFDIFKSETGVDLVGDAAAGSLVVSANIAIQDEGTTISSPTSVINFTGAGVTASAGGNGVVNVNIPGNGGGSTGTGGGGLVITGISPNRGPTVGGTTVTISGINLTGATAVTFGGTAASSVTNISANQVRAVTPPHAVGGVDVVVTTPLGNTAFSQGFTYYTEYTFLERLQVYPPDRNPVLDFLDDPVGSTTGNFYVRFTGGPSGTLYAPLSLGSGNIKLYQSDGTLVSTVAAGSCSIDNDVLSIPFPPREPGVDMYVLMDQGVVTYCDSVSPAITTPTVWNFAVTPYETESVPMIGSTLSEATVYTATAISYVPTGIAVGRNDVIRINYNLGITKGTGTAQIREYLSDTVVQTITADNAVFGATSVTLGQVTFGQPSAHYYITTDADFALYNEPDCHLPKTPSYPITKQNNFEFTMVPRLKVIKLFIRTSPFEGDIQKTNKRTYLGLQFNRAIQYGQSGSIKLFNGSGTLIQEFKVTSSFETDKSSDIISIIGDIVYINPTKNFEQGVEYYVNGTPQSIQDFKGFAWSGETSTTALRFRVDPGPTAVAVPVTNDSATIDMEFDRAIEPGPGKVQIYDGNNNLVSELSSDDPRISYS